MDFEKSKEYKKIFKFSASSGSRLTSREGVTIEFKESFNWGSKSEYGKTIAAFANNKGGFIVFGVKNKPRDLIGLQSNNFDDQDEAIITQYLNSVFSPEIDFEKSILDVRGKNIGILHISKSQNKPIVAIKNDGDIKEGEIYYRYTARSDKIKFPELKNLLDEIKSIEKERWMNLFERISLIGPENTALVNMAAGKIEGNTGTLVIDQKLIPKIKFIQEGKFKETGSPTLKLVGEVRPVSIASGSSRGGGMRIADDPNAPAIRVKEDEMLEEFNLEYRALTKKLYERYSDFKSNEKYYKLKKALAGKGFSFVRKLNPRNAKSTQQEFYSPRIFKEFDKHYTKKL
jgi:hypothetical protein